MSHGTTKRDIKAKERATQALQLRKAGLSLEEIAAQCQYKDRSGAYRAIKRELDRLPVEDAEDLRKLEMLRLDHLQTICYKRMLAKETKDPLWAVDRLLAISEARRKLMGLDRPVTATQHNNVVVVREMPINYLGALPMEGKP